MEKEKERNEDKLPYPWKFDREDPLKKILRQKITKRYIDSLNLQRGSEVEYATISGHQIGYYLNHNERNIEIADCTSAKYKYFKDTIIPQAIFPDHEEGDFFSIFSRDGFGDLFYLIRRKG